MAAAKKNVEREIIKLKPTIFPLGFRIARIEDDFLILDFVDTINGQSTILESIALPLAKALQLSGALAEAAQDETTEE